MPPWIRLRSANLSLQPNFLLVKMAQVSPNDSVGIDATSLNRVVLGAKSASLGVERKPVYVVFDAEGKEIARYTPTSAQLAKAAKPKMDCFEISCPSSFDENV